MMMVDDERTITALAAQAMSRPPVPDVISLLKRVPNNLKWRLIKAVWSMVRDVSGIVHRLQGRQIVHFLHIGKTGGTAVKASIRGHEDSCRDMEIALREHEIELVDIPRGEKVVFFVRDPVSRFVSGFYNRFRKARPRHDIPWTPAEEAIFTQFDTPNKLALALSSNDKELQRSAANAIQGIEHINRPQWLWFKSEAYFLSRKSDILFIGFQESLNNDFMLLKRILNLPDTVRLPDNEVSAHRTPTNLDKRLDELAIKNLKAWYRKDYEFLDVCRKIAAEIRKSLDEHLPDVIPSEVAGAAVMAGEFQSPQARSTG
jgi:hypothetical protein